MEVLRFHKRGEPALLRFAVPQPWVEFHRRWGNSLVHRRDTLPSALPAVSCEKVCCLALAFEVYVTQLFEPSGSLEAMIARCAAAVLHAWLKDRPEVKDLDCVERNVAMVQPLQRSHNSIIKSGRTGCLLVKGVACQRSQTCKTRDGCWRWAAHWRPRG